MKNRVIITLAAIVIATLSSCNDKEKIEIDHNTYYPYSQPSFVTSVAQAESMSHDLLTTALEFATDTSLRNFSGYPIVTSTSDTSFPRTISIDFGNSDTTTLLHTSLNDFRTRSGILNVTLSDDWHTTGSNMVITATSLRLSNTMTFTGVLEFANRGTRTYQSKPCYVFDFVTNNATVTKNDGYSFRYSATKMYYFVDGDTTENLSDDVFHISGTASAVRDTNHINISIIGPYYAPRSCYWFKSGTADATENSIRWTFSFDNSTCSPLAYLIFRIINGETYNEMKRYIELP